jgi:hypothetical protein
MLDGMVCFQAERVDPACDGRRRFRRRDHWLGRSRGASSRPFPGRASFSPTAGDSNGPRRGLPAHLDFGNQGKVMREIRGLAEGGMAIGLLSRRKTGHVISSRSGPGADL